MPTTIVLELVAGVMLKENPVTSAYEPEVVDHSALIAVDVVCKTFPTPESRAAGTVPLPRLEAFKAVKLIPLDAGIVAGGVSVEALMSNVAPDGTEIVSPDVPISRAVPLWGSSLSTFNTDAIFYPYNCDAK